MNWYVVQTKPRKEDDVSKRLKLASIETLNPKVSSFVKKITPLFPNYIFVRWNLEDTNNYHMLKFTRGVHRVLGTKTAPVPILDLVIQTIRERLNSSEVLEQHQFRVGTRVKIKKGILKDLEGILEKPVSAQGRVAVLLSLYEREMKATFHIKDIAVAA